MSLQNYSIEEAAQALRCYPRFLEDNLKRLPHQKIGAAVVFDEDELRAIKDMFRVRPTEFATPMQASANKSLSLATITPSGRTRTG